MGDMMKRTREETFDFVDRKKYLIKSGGENIYPAEIERVLLSDPRISEVAVVKAPDDKWGEAVQAAVETHKDQPADEADIIQYVKSRLDSVKAPKRVHFVDELPRSPVGKVLRREAKAQFQES